jgi:hypothetical protein
MNSAFPFHTTKLLSYRGWLLCYCGALVGFVVQGAANYAYARLTALLFSWLPQMQWQWSDWHFSPWYPVAGIVLGAFTAQCLVLRGQGQLQTAANRAFWVGCGATILSFSFVCFFLYAQFHFAYDWCGNASIGAPTGIYSYKAQTVGTIIFTNVPLQSSMFLLFWGWRQKCALRFTKAPSIVPIVT